LKGSKRLRGNSWELSVSCGFDGNGKRIRHTKTLKPVLKDGKWVPLLVSEADEALRDFIGQVKGIYAGRMTVGEYLDYWINIFIDPEQAPKKAKKTIRWYKMNVNYHLKPNIGHILLKELNAHDIKRMLNEIAIKTENEKISIDGIYRTLRAALETAVGVYIDINPAKNKTARPPRTTKAEMKAKHNYYNVDQAVRLLLTAKRQWYEAQKWNEFTRMNIYVIYFIALIQSMREGEICGLQWADCDFDNRVIDIKGQLITPGMDPVFGPPKTEESTRKIRMAKSIADLLQEVKKYQDMAKKEAQKAKKPWHDYNLVFCQNDGRPVNPENLTKKHLKKTIALANQDAKPDEMLSVIRFHDLRGSSATLLYELGEDPWTIASILGHVDPQIADDHYIHQKLKRQDSAITAIDQLFSDKLNINIKNII
jgi:integrase